MNDKNRFVCEKLGLCWHEPIACPDGESIRCVCGEIHWHGYPDNPDFSTDVGAVDLLRLMMKRDDWGGGLSESFINYLMRTQNMWSVIDMMATLITTPGALLDAVYEFFGGEK